MNLKVIFSLLVLGCLWGSGYAQARIWRVPQDVATIEDTITQVRSGDEVIISPGTYQEVLGIPNGTILYVHSVDPTNPAIVESTIIGRIVLNGASSPQCRIAGFTVSGSDQSGVRGNGAYGTIEYCHIMNCYGIASDPNPDLRFGGAFNRCNGIIQNCIVDNNVATHGGAFYQCNGMIQNNLIVRNTCIPFSGGAGAAFYDCNGIIRNNSIIDNGVKIVGGFNPQWEGGGLVKCNGVIMNNIIWVSRSDLMPEFTTCSVPRYSCIKGWNGGGVGNFNMNPGLVNAKFQDDLGPQPPKTGLNWKLRPDSPCIDAGKSTATVASDLEGTPRGIVWRTQGVHGDNTHTDIGAYEFDAAPVCVWIPKESDPATGLRSVPVYWALSEPSGGTTMTLTLERQSGAVLGGMGTFFFPGGHTTFETAGLIKLMLPQAVTADDYLIRMRGSAGGVPEALTPAFTILRFSDIESWIWTGY